MKKSILTMAVIAASLSLTSCREYSREQDRLDRESEGKGDLLKAESTKKIKIEQAKADLESAKMEAETKVSIAEGNAKAKIIAAKAEAERKLIIAESESKANKMLNESITPTILEYFKIEKWNGKLPTTVAGQGSNTLINIK